MNNNETIARARKHAYLEVHVHVSHRPDRIRVRPAQGAEDLDAGSGGAVLAVRRMLLLWRFRFCFRFRQRFCVFVLFGFMLLFGFRIFLFVCFEGTAVSWHTGGGGRGVLICCWP